MRQIAAPCPFSALQKPAFPVKFMNILTPFRQMITIRIAISRRGRLVALKGFFKFRESFVSGFTTCDFQVSPALVLDFLVTANIEGRRLMAACVLGLLD
jgi:hypothetical protein